MTTKFLTIKFAKLPNFIVMELPRKKQRFWTIFRKFSPSSTPSKTQILLILSFRRPLSILRVLPSTFSKFCVLPVFMRRTSSAPYFSSGNPKGVQRLKNIKDRPLGFKVSSEIENSSEPPTKPYFCGGGGGNSEGQD